LLYKLLLSSKHTIMSSFYSDASLVMIPSGYKTSKVYSAKPTDGAGDLVFTRSNDTATRVASNGLIEKVRTNLLLQSNTFSTTWALTTASVTSGQAGYDGTNNAWELNSSASGGRILQSNTQAGLQTFSVYAKGSVSSGIRLYAFGTVNANAYFNLNLGTVGAIGGSGVTAKIEAVGGGWYRCSISFNQTNVSVRLYTSDNANAEAAGTIYIQNAQLEAGDIATDYIATTTAAVSVGPVANVPRLDYLGSSCPRLLLEPQRQNVLLNSEDASSQPTAGTVTVSSNSSISPDGYQNADTITADSSSYLRPTVTTGVGTAIAWSLFLKNVNSAESILMVRTSSTAIQVNVAWTGAVPSATVVGGTGGVKVINYGNDWYRFEITTTSADNSTYFRVYPSNSTSASVISWGSQVELNASYSTSYIPTLGASVTRGADSASKTGIASLIGQTEGTLFAEFTYNGSASSTAFERIIAVGDGTVDNRIIVIKNNTNSQLYVFVANGNVAQVNSAGITGTNIIGIHKVAFAYKANDFVCYFDGVQVFSDTIGTVPAVSNLYVGTNEASSLNELGGTISQALLFKTRLENDDLAALTAL
jgi:hypothetical protein